MPTKIPTTTATSLKNGAQVGSYRIEALVGVGDSSEIYKAQDTVRNRTVAVKVLKSTAATEQQLALARITPQVVQLSHPHLCAFHEIGKHEEIGFLAMEYLDGETLAARLKRGPLPVPDALKIASSIAAALEKAHQAGLLHLAVNPSNVMLTAAGPKLLNLGWSKPRVESSPAVTAGASTKPGDASSSSGVIRHEELQYLAPEQLEGKAADARADLFALGQLLYVMITGKKAFEGKTRAILLAAIDSTDPEPISSLQASAPAVLDHVAARCLAKNPDERWQDAHGLLVELKWIAESAIDVESEPGSPNRLAPVGVAVALLLLVAAVTLTLLYLRGPAEPEAFQARIPLRGLSPGDIAISPDGKSIALVATPDIYEASSLFVRSIATASFIRIGGSEDATQPFWSPNNQSIGFVVAGKLKTALVSGGPPKLICDAPDFGGGTWNRDGTILYGSAKGLYRVSEQGGRPELITTPDSSVAGYFWPWFLPDGNHYLYVEWSEDGSSNAVFAGSLNAKERTRVMPTESAVAYADPGFLIFQRDSTLFAQPFDPKKLAVSGKPIHLADEVTADGLRTRGNFHVSDAHALLYNQGTTGQSNRRGGRGGVVAAQFGWVNASGAPIAEAGVQGVYGDIDLAPNGNSIALTRFLPGELYSDIWIMDLQRAANLTRLTRDSGDNIHPIWAPDGTNIAFTSYRNGTADIYVKKVNTAGAEIPILQTASEEIVKDWSKDGRYIAYLSGPDAAQDIYVLPIAPDGKPVPGTTAIPMVVGKFRKGEPQFSFDGKWLAYASEVSGAFEVYVISFPGQEQVLKISQEGGGRPRWRGDGKEIYYLEPVGGRVMAVDLTYGAKLEAGVPRRLFLGLGADSARDPRRHLMSVTPDGNRFLVRVQVGAATGVGGATPLAPQTYTPPGQAAGTVSGARGNGGVSQGLTVVLHWTSSLAKEAK